MAKESTDTKLNKDVPGEEQRSGRFDFLNLHPQVGEQLQKTLEYFMQFPHVRNGEPYLSLEERALYAICLDAKQSSRSTWMKKRPERKFTVSMIG